MLQYKSNDGQSVSDICLQTYGSLDYLSKLMSDNNISDINTTIESDTIIMWDVDLCVDKQLYDYWNKGNIRLTTL